MKEDMRRGIEAGRIRNGGKRVDSGCCRYCGNERRIFERGGTLVGLEEKNCRSLTPSRGPASCCTTIVGCPWILW